MAPAMSRADREILEFLVLQELTCDSYVDETGVGVDVGDGVVTLTGTVNSTAQKMAAQDAAHRVAGDLDVGNDIQVKFSDEPLTLNELANRDRAREELDEPLRGEPVPRR
jgi:hypothetical protein